MRGKKYFELLQKSLKALAEIQKLEMNRSMAMDLSVSMSRDRSPFSLRSSPRFNQSSSVEVRKVASKSPILLNCARKLDLSALAGDGAHSALELAEVNPDRRGSTNSEKAGGTQTPRLEADWEKRIPSGELMFMEEELESFAPVEGDTLTFYKVHKERVADRSGGPLPERAKKEKAVPLKPPNILIKGALVKKIQLEIKKLSPDPSSQKEEVLSITEVGKDEGECP